MKTTALFTHLRSLGATMRVDGLFLLVEPADRISEEIIQELRASKPMIVRLLSEHRWGAVPGVIPLRRSPSDDPTIGRGCVDFASAQIGETGPLCAWCLNREGDYWNDGVGPHESTMAACVDLACWQLRCTVENLPEALASVGAL